MSGSRRSRRQDVKHGDPLRQCRGFNAKGEPVYVSFSPSAERKRLLVSERRLLCCVCSGEASEGDGAVRSGRQQHLPGVSAAFASGNRQVALPAGGKEETGENFDSDGMRAFENRGAFLSVREM